MPIAIVVGCAPVVMFTGAAEARGRPRRAGASPAALAGAPIRWRSAADHRPRRAGRRRDRDRRPDRSARCSSPKRRSARATAMSRSKPTTCRCRSPRSPTSKNAGVRLDHQPGDAERIERDQEGRLRAAVPRAPARRSSAIKGVRRVVMHERLTNLRPVIFVQFAAGTPRTEVWRGAARRGDPAIATAARSSSR